MKIKIGLIVFLVAGLISSGCVPTQGGNASDRADISADQKMYKAVTYRNSYIKGPTVVVLPGQIKSNNAAFRRKITVNNIADFAELELGLANFKVLERSDLGSLLEEVTLAANMGDAEALNKFKRGKFKTAKWFVKFDILKAEKLTQARQSFSGEAAGNTLDTSVSDVDGSFSDTVAPSLKTVGSARIWIVSLKYKVIDALTSKQVSTGYIEKKMNLDKQGISVLGVSQTRKGRLTLENMVHRLVQEAVADIDVQK